MHFAIIPLVGFIIVLVGLILMLVGLYTAGRADAAYQTAFIVTIVNLVLNLFSGLIPLLGIVCDVLGIVQVYLICTTSARLLAEKGDTVTAARGLFVWKLYVACIAVEILCFLLLGILGLYALMVLLSFVMLIVSLVGAILYLIFLYRASNSLQY